MSWGRESHLVCRGLAAGLGTQHSLQLLEDDSKGLWSLCSLLDLLMLDDWLLLLWR